MGLARIAAACAQQAHESQAETATQIGNPYAEQLSTVVVNECALLFTRLSRSVCQTIALESRIAADHAAAHPSPGRPAPRQNPPRHPRSHRETTPTAPTSAAAPMTSWTPNWRSDPYARATLPDLLSTICEDLGFKLDYESLAEQLAPEYFAWSMGNGAPPH